MWGTWWWTRVWPDADLFLLYLGYIALANAFDNRERSAAPPLLVGVMMPDHQILGRLVEHPASTGQRVENRRAGDRSVDVVAAVFDGRWHESLFPGV